MEIQLSIAESTMLKQLSDQQATIQSQITEVVKSVLDSRALDTNMVEDNSVTFSEDLSIITIKQREE